jgi:hypothetical protein
MLQQNVLNLNYTRIVLRIPFQSLEHAVKRKAIIKGYVVLNYKGKDHKKYIKVLSPRTKLIAFGLRIKQQEKKLIRLADI